MALDLGFDVSNPFYQGEDVLLTLSLDPPSPAGGVAAWSVRFVLVDPVSGQVVLTRDNGAVGGVTVFDAALGVWKVALPSAATRLPAEEPYKGYHCEFARTDAGADTELGNGVFPLAPAWAT